MRAKRIEAQRSVDDAKQREKAAALAIIERLKAEKSTKSSGAIATASITKKTEPVVDNWPKVYAHIKKTGDFELLHQRIASRAWAERVTAGKTVPGVSSIEVEELSLTKATRSE
jgi:hypothetical protein